MFCSCIQQDAVAHAHAAATPPGDARADVRHGGGPPAASLAAPPTSPGYDTALASAAFAAQAQVAAGARPSAPMPRGHTVTAAAGASTAEDVSVRRAAGLAFVTPSGHLNLPPLEFDALTAPGGAARRVSGGGVRRSFLGPAGTGGGAPDSGSYADPWLLPSRPTTTEEGPERRLAPGRGRRGPAAAAAAALGGKARRQRHYHHNDVAELDGDAGGVSSNPQSRNTTEDGYLAQLAPPPWSPPLATSRSAAAASAAASAAAADGSRPFSGRSSVFSAGGGGGAAATAATAAGAALPDIAETLWGGDGRGASRTFTGATDASAAADDEGDGADDRRERRWVRRLLAGLRGADGHTRTPSVVVFTQRRPPLNQRFVGQTWWTKIKGWVAAGRGGADGGGGAAAVAAAGDGAVRLAGVGVDARARQHTGGYSDACKIGSVCIAGDSRARHDGLSGEEDGAAAVLGGRGAAQGLGLLGLLGGPDVDYSHRTVTSQGGSSPDTSVRYGRDSSPARPVEAPAAQNKPGRQPKPAPPPSPLPPPQPSPGTVLLPPLSPADGFGHGYDMYSRAGTPMGGPARSQQKSPVPPPALPLLLQQRPSNPRFGHRPPPPPAADAAASPAAELTSASAYDADLSVHGGNAVLLYDGSQHHEQVLAAYGMLQPASHGSPVSSGQLGGSGSGRPGGAGGAAAAAVGEAGGSMRPSYSRSGSGASGAAAAAAAAGCGSLVGAGGSRRGLRASASLRHAPSPPPPPPPEELTDLDTDAESEEEDTVMASLRLAQSLTRSQPQQVLQTQPVPLHDSNGTAVTAHVSLPPVPVSAARAPAARTVDSAFARPMVQAQSPSPSQQVAQYKGLGRASSERVGADASLWAAATATACGGDASRGAERKGRGGVEGRVRGGITFRTFLSQNTSHPESAAAYAKPGGGGGPDANPEAGLDVGADVDVPIFDLLRRDAPDGLPQRQRALPVLQPPVQQQQQPCASTLQPAASSPSPLTRTPTQDLADADEFVGDTLPQRRVRPRRHTDATGNGGAAAYGAPAGGPASSASPVYAAAVSGSGYGPRLNGGGSRRGLPRAGSSTGARGSPSGGVGASGQVWGSGLGDSNGSDGGGAEPEAAEWLLADGGAGCIIGERNAGRGGGGGAPVVAAGAAPVAAAADWLSGYLPGSLSRNSELVLT
ncbi:hypothetical protein HXX76_003589 [Chlamydomonas incerta]|uniref:Uncharacterized protein n=1 Tax=Chlamydomonas incerta TaxID=51695 RepID=A0A835TBQ6_CHLIN|nr:hypothetical protein HXX76_003589 [Chlamydomonas incerta]|eukprot:KAG2440732.1 hypothetical protein HXX76_003589 [Chlamydomonas incerta]